MFIIGEKQDEEESNPFQLDQSNLNVESAGTDDEQINDIKFSKKWRPPKTAINNEREVTPLTAFVYDVNQFGNLTIAFNKPIIVPNFIINNKNRTIGFSGRQLAD